MQQAIAAIRADMRDNSLLEYGEFDAFYALRSAGINPADLEYSLEDMILLTLREMCLEALSK